MFITLDDVIMRPKCARCGAVEPIWGGWIGISTYKNLALDSEGLPTSVIEDYESYCSWRCVATDAAETAEIERAG